MTRKRFNVVTIAAMIAILALGGLGLGYATWTDSLSINADASTGSLDVQWVSGTVSGTETPITAYADCIATFDSVNAVSVDVIDIFPGYSCVLSAQITNLGTLPAQITGIAPSVALPAGVTAVSSCDTNTVVQPNTPVTCTVTISMDAGETGNQSQTTVNTTYTLSFVQAP